MGYDFNFSYKKLVQVSLYVQKGAKFIGTNPDKHTMLQNYKIPGCGSMMKSIE